MTFVDRFAGVAEGYAAFRPTYPAELIAHLAGLCPERELAWDVGTGSGQAAVCLAAYFTRVIATDASAGQIAKAQPHPRISYRVAVEDASSLQRRSTDLVTVAQALHWFDLPRFYREVRRVLKPGGIIAAWTYGLMRVDPAVDEIVDRFYAERVGHYWPPERRMVENEYRGIDFPFEELEPGRWSIAAPLTRGDVIGFIGTWSAVSAARQAEGLDPVAEVAEALAGRWPDGREARLVTWPLAVRVGRLK